MSRTVAFACTLAVGGMVALQPPATPRSRGIRGAGRGADQCRDHGDHPGGVFACVLGAGAAVRSGRLQAALRDRRHRRSRRGGRIAGGGASARVAGVVSLLVAGQLVISVATGWDRSALRRSD